MPRDERVLVVLAASPSDMASERGVLEEVIRELNLTWSRKLGIRLDLVRWETHGYPGFGVDAQDVLNSQLPDDPDIFVGLMWGRYGTSTDRAGSGTEEEFQRAFGRFQKDSTSIKIMIYFKDAPIAPSQIDPKQLARVQDFRSSLGDEGGLYWNFGKEDEFERLIRIHLARQIQEFSGGQQGKAMPDKAAQIDSEDVSSETSEELGLIDYLDLVDEHFGSLIEITKRISDETETPGPADAGTQQRDRGGDCTGTTREGQSPRSADSDRKSCWGHDQLRYPNASRIALVRRSTAARC